MTEFKPGEYLTRDGRKARVYATDGSPEYPIHGAILVMQSSDDEGGWHSESWQAKGAYIENEENGRDLMQPKREMWVNVYPSTTAEACVTSSWPTKEIADQMACTAPRIGRIARVRVEYTEGQFDE